MESRDHYSHVRNLLADHLYRRCYACTTKGRKILTAAEPDLRTPKQGEGKEEEEREKESEDGQIKENVTVMNDLPVELIQHILSFVRLPSGDKLKTLIAYYSALKQSKNSYYIAHARSPHRKDVGLKLFIQACRVPVCRILHIPRY